ncbi:Structure-specific endonuclease subunit SLX4 [Nakaseomyces glabratus]|nr:Structure-specific endonuclease subunit SLX4 [Nakaseomyces glabratus]KTB16594.1 Structure-specific endonuclease subunit SLX4 [Nakaseomyces glabratus]
MDFERAQKNFDAFLINGETDETPNDELRHESQHSDFDTCGTQVPEMNFSDDDNSDCGNNEIDRLAHNATETTDKEGDDSIIVTQERIAENRNNSVIEIEDEDQIDLSVVNSKEEDNIFLNTQIQSRLDDHEKDLQQKAVLKSFNFEYVDKDESPNMMGSRYIRKKSPKKRNSRKNTEEAIQASKSISKRQNNANSLLQILSGKKSKVNAIIKNQRFKYESKTGVLKRASQVSNSTSTTYGKEEWKQIKNVLRTRYSKLENSDDRELENFINYLSEQLEKEPNLWTSSQIAISTNENNESYRQDSIGSLLTLSQVMGDKSAILESDDEYPDVRPNGESFFKCADDSQQLKDDLNIVSQTNSNTNVSGVESVHGLEGKNLYSMGEKEEVTNKMTDFVSKEVEQSQVPLLSIHRRGRNNGSYFIFDSSDEYKTIIEIDSSIRQPMDNSNEPSITNHRRTPVFSKSQSILDQECDSIEDISLSQGSFKAVTTLISPVKDGSTAQNSQAMDIPTQFSGIPRLLDLKTVPKLPFESFNENSKDYRIIISKKKLLELKQAIKRLANIELTEEHEVLGNIDGQPGEELFAVVLSISNNLELLSSPGVDTHTKEKSPSLAELRKDLDKIGLKPVRLKSQIIENLASASQVVTVDESNQKKVGVTSKSEVFEFLTHLVKQEPDLLTRIYCFQPITMNDLINKLRNKDSFVDLIDDGTIREWTDKLGICIRSNNLKD